MHNTSQRHPLNCTTFAAALFVVKTYETRDLVNFVKELQPMIPYSQTYQKFKEIGQKADENDDECMVDTKQVNIKLMCDFTMAKLTTPVRG